MEHSIARIPSPADVCYLFAVVKRVRQVSKIQDTATYLLQKVINVKVHLKNSFFPALIVQGNDECAGRGRCDVEVNVWTSI